MLSTEYASYAPAASSMDAVRGLNMHRHCPIIGHPALYRVLMYLDAATGALRASYAPSNRFLSIRHLAVGRDGRVGIALQYEGPQEDTVPLIGFQRPGEPIVLAAAPDTVLRGLNHYTASICLHPGIGMAAVTCPRGGQATLWDAEKARFVAALPIRDAGGAILSADGECFVVSNGLEEIHTIRADTLTATSPPITVPDTMWDNHLTLTRAV